ncbi:MAG: cation transporter [Halobacteriovoraceae bacterium]|nr:cation transporter [Halobacteriovoraceae bacterium]
MSQTVSNALFRREKEIKRVLIITLFLNLFVAGIKLLIGHWYGLLSLSSSGLESVFDGSSNVLALISIYLAHRPADEGHNYGHYKIETLGAILIALILFLSGVQMSIEVYERFHVKKVTTDIGIAPFITILVSMATSGFVSWYEKMKAKKLNSSILAADSEHTFGDFVISFGVLISIAFHYYGYFWPDIFVGAIISLYMIYLGIKIVSSNLPELLDASPEISIELQKLVQQNKKILDVHKFRVRGTSYFLYIDFHLLLEETLSLKDAHSLAHETEDKLKEHLLKQSIKSDITIHIEPFEEEHID